MTENLLPLTIVQTTTDLSCMASAVEMRFNTNATTINPLEQKVRGSREKGPFVKYLSVLYSGINLPHSYEYELSQLLLPTLILSSFYPVTMN